MGKSVTLVDTILREEVEFSKMKSAAEYIKFLYHPEKEVANIRKLMSNCKSGKINLIYGRFFVKAS